MKDRNVAKELGVCGADLDKEGMEREPTPRVAESKFVLTLEHFSSLVFDSLAEGRAALNFLPAQRMRDSLE